MNMIEISISNSKKKSILASITDPDVLFQDENGDLVVKTQAYKELKERTGKAFLEELLELDQLESLAEYVVFQ